jgi:hypothetical protein
MEVFRKPATAEWHYGSAHEFDRSGWHDQCHVTFDATKDKTGDRHTTMQIVFTETDVERLYAGLVQGRKEQIKALKEERDSLQKQLGLAAKAIGAHLRELQQRFMKAPYDSEEEALFK